MRKLTYIGRKGAPDRLLVLPYGRVFFIELKRPGGEAEPHQLREHTRLRRIGADVRVLDTLEAVDAFFNEVAP
ncbi:VRR-NUC domain-containing protein [Paraburkholderia sp. BL21I4N1]|uniref:VRR-NUC domain-containing protein n=1 Tax=Paraburkholderia sp. BL21I4N1 TaxID=1938801 RepID=UPI0021573236|nr:VRR-NUC domain-containing protein [Paraburkholderia sp. BL21I4N1]